MTDKTNIDSSPVGLGAGSYDYDKLKGGLEAASTLSGQERDDAVAKTLSDVDATGLAKIDQRGIDGYAFRKHHNSDLGVDEHIQVFVDGADAQKAEIEAAKSKGVKPGDTKNTGGAGAPTSGE